jgi:Enoyl-(Acyl carrier protein) reductase
MSRPDWTDCSVAGSQPGQVALGRTGRPDEIPGLMCFLLSDEAAYCTGSEFMADGGPDLRHLPTRGQLAQPRAVTSIAHRQPAALSL